MRARQGEQVTAELVEAGAIAALLAAAHLATMVSVEWDPFIPMLLNLLLALSALWLMASGFLSDEVGRVNLSLALIVLYVITRFFDYSTTLPDRSLLFIGAGVILLAGGYLLDRGRRRLLEAMREKESDA